MYLPDLVLENGGLPQSIWQRHIPASRISYEYLALPKEHSDFKEAFGVLRFDFEMCSKQSLSDMLPSLIDPSE